MSLSLPESYASLPFQHIRLSHVPASSPTPTKVILVTLYRPGKHNAFTGIMIEELERTFDLLSADSRVRCVVLTGHGYVSFFPPFPLGSFVPG
jgi:enoyl-CoA hydratase/carnithine racemase